MFITDEYTTLTKGDKEIVILPNKPFEGIPAGYKISASALIKNDKGKVIHILKPGQITTELKGETISQKRRRVRST